VRYRTSDGRTFDTVVMFERPVTITDDLNPLGVFWTKERVEVETGNGH
jgi:hypothetical protein